MKVRFLKDVVYETEGPGRGPLLEAGSVHELREDLARRWINRQVAEEVATSEPSRRPRAPKGMVPDAAGAGKGEAAQSPPANEPPAPKLRHDGPEEQAPDGVSPASGGNAATLV